MSSESPAPFGGDEQSINPYAASRAPDAALEPAVSSEPPPERHYGARLTWADREALLRSVGPIRVALVLTALSWLRLLYEHVTEWAEFIWVDGLSDARNIASFTLGIVFAGQGLLLFYTCRVEWKYAEALRLVAGGSTNDMRTWSRLHWQTSWLWAVLAIVTVTLEALYWLLERSFS